MHSAAATPPPVSGHTHTPALPPVGGRGQPSARLRGLLIVHARSELPRGGSVLLAARASQVNLGESLKLISAIF